MKRIIYLACLLLAVASCKEAITPPITPFLEISSSLIKPESNEDTYQSITIKTNEIYEVVLDSDWVSIYANEKGADEDVITLLCLENKRGEERDAVLTIKGETITRTVRIIQSAREYQIVQNGDEVTVFSTEAGKLYEKYKTVIKGETPDKQDGGVYYGVDNWADVKKLTIEGVTNAADYACIKYNFKALEYLDVENTTIEEYFGSRGGGAADKFVYDAEALPLRALSYGVDYFGDWVRPDEEEMNFGMLYLKSVKLPNTIKRVDPRTFTGVISLEEVTIPEGVEDVGALATYKVAALPHGTFRLSSISGCTFNRCYNLEKVYLPSTLKRMGEATFINCYNLKEVHIAAKQMPELGTSDWGDDMTFGLSLDFWNQYEKFGVYIHGLTSWTYYTKEYYEPMTTATLYVPKGCKDNYKEWERYFSKIVEE